MQASGRIQANPHYLALLERLAHGGVVILDGGVGTEIQRRGAPMSTQTWCADANLTHPDIVRAVHRDYIAAGAEIITANTFAASPLLLEAHGRLGDLERIDATAVRLAREAAAGTSVVIAGSMSTMRPTVPGSDRTQLERDWPEDAARTLFARKARSLTAAGCDLILMEMMRDLDYSLWACEAALASGLPVWIGLAAERGADGSLRGFGRPDMALEPVAQRLAALQPDAMGIMHTSPNDTGDALAILHRHWQGPIAVYPECGYYRAPNWEFVDIIPPEELARHCDAWRGAGANIVGGCCGIGPEHIARLRQEFAP